MPPKQDLYDQLFDLSSKDSLHDGRPYITVDFINDNVTRDSIKAELGNKSGSWFRSGGRLADTVVKMNARKLFTILVYIDKPWNIVELLNDGLTDEHLPLSRQGEGLRPDHGIIRTFNPPVDWKPQIVDLFFDNQWRVLAPVFKVDGEHLRLDRRCPLPFPKSKLISKPFYSFVHEVEVEISHQEWFKAERSRPRVALKEFKRTADFEQEQRNLQTIKKFTKNKHITQSLATFSLGDRNFIIFPLAEGGHLDNFWKTRQPHPRSSQLALWCLEQMLGLTEALQALHKGIDDKIHCLHGDLQPGNILHFYGDGEGTLQISDFGISNIRVNAMTSRGKKEKPTTTRGTTPSYEAPEASPTFSKNQARSCKYDIWSLGCIFLEFTIWFVRGWAALESFTTTRTECLHGKYCAFFYQITNEAKVHPKVSDSIDNLKEFTLSREGTAFGDLLNIIEGEMIQVDVKDRLEAADLCNQLRDIVKKAKSDPNYLLNNEVLDFWR